MMKKHILNLSLALTGICVLNSCLIYQGVQAFVREEYPGTRPPMVIKDVDGKPANQNWLKSPSDMLPPSSYISAKNVSKASDGTPYGMTTEYKDIIISPHYPHHKLDYTGFSAGDKVWDPYTRKPFYIKRTYTFN